MKYYNYLNQRGVYKSRMKVKTDLFKTTFIVSLVFHSLILFPIPEINNSSLKKNNFTYMRYFCLENPAQKHDYKSDTKSGVLTNKIVPKKSDESQSSRKSKRYLNENMVIEPKNKEGNNTNTQKDMNTKPGEIIEDNRDILEKDKQISTVPVENDISLQHNKSYISYYELINEKLRKSIIYPQYFSEGEIAISFVLTADGSLENIQINDKGSSQNSVLRKTAIQIVKKASPFPPFPQDLHRIQLTFNVVICFREKG